MILVYLTCLPFGAFSKVASKAQWPSVTQLAETKDMMIEKIIIKGAQRVEVETIKSYLLVRKGDFFKQARLDRSLKSLFATGLFADVSFSFKGATLIINVLENPLINRVAFEGNDSREDEELASEISLRSRVIYTRTKVQNDVKRILSIYQKNGRFAAKVEPKVVQLPQNRIDLIFEINEGETTEINSVRFVGNQNFSDSKLREVIRTKKTAWWRFLSNDDIFDKDRIALDQELLRRFYMSDGYADFRVLSSVAELTPDKKTFFITFTLEEGPRYRFGKIDINAKLRDLKSNKLADLITIEKGDWFDISAIDKMTNAINGRVGELGYAFVDVRSKMKRSKVAKDIDIIFEVVEGPRVFVERIDISGNVRTIDKVIRREFKVIEGDAFNSTKLKRSKQRIENLGYFEKVAIRKTQGSSPDKTVIKTEVEEQSTGTINIGAGYSSTIGVLGEFGISERNFLGKGQKLALKTTLATTKSQIDLSFTEPYFLDRELSAGFDVFHTKQDFQNESSFDLQRSGLGLRTGYPITDDLSQSWKYLVRRSKTESVPSSASTLIKAAEGTETLSEITHAINYNQLDSSVNPTDGYFIGLTTNLAGAGGSQKHLKNFFRGEVYHKIAEQWIGSLKGNVGYALGLGEDLHLLERFHLGGNNLRGFENRGADPRDTGTDDALGGEWIYSASLSLTFPFGLPTDIGILGRVFTDFGGIGGVTPSNSTTRDPGSVRASTGVGLTYTSPLGPIGMDYGIPFIKESFDKEQGFRLTFGARF